MLKLEDDKLYPLLEGLIFQYGLESFNSWTDGGNHGNHLCHVFVLKNYKKSTEIIWCQEEPQNQGPWSFVKPQIEACLSSSQSLRYVGRKAAAAPAVGISKLHVKEQQEIVSEALKV